MAIKLKNTGFVKNLIKNHKLAGYIDKALLDGEFEWEAKFKPKEDDNAWHPSGDCTPSAYALYEKATATEPGKGPSPGLLKAYTVGHFWHAYIQWIVVEKLGFSSWDEIERRGTKAWGSPIPVAPSGPSNPLHGVNAVAHQAWRPYQWATGLADIAPCHIPAYGEALVDIKTMGSHDFKQNGLPNWCAGKYECQVNIYMDFFDLERTIILCVSKDSPHDFKEFIFQRNQPLIDAIYSKWRLVGACVDEQVAPPEDYETILPLVGPKM